MSPLNGGGKLRIQRGDGTAIREINCRLSDGLTGDDGSYFKNMTKVVLSFRAFDPYWQDINQTSYTCQLGNLKSWFPIFPLVLTNSTVFGDVTITNPGEVETYPVITFVGPGVNPGLENLTTGKKFTTNTIGLTLSASDKLEVDCRPGLKTVKLNGVNAFSTLDGGSSLFSIVPGANAIRAYMASGQFDSVITVNYYPRYLTP